MLEGLIIGLMCLFGLFSSFMLLRAVYLGGLLAYVSKMSSIKCLVESIWLGLYVGALISSNFVAYELIWQVVGLCKECSCTFLVNFASLNTVM